MNRVYGLLLAFLVLVAGVGCVGLDNLSANKLTKSTSAGVEVELAHWAYWDKNCRGENFSVTIATTPKNGQIIIRDSVYAIPSRTSNGNLTGCVDKIVESKKVVYLPNEGFRGQDEAIVKFSGSTGSVANAYTIAVN